MDLMERVRHDSKIRKAYINELRRKDGKYNFVLVPLYNFGNTKYTPIYLNKYRAKIKSIMINGQVVAINQEDLIILSLKPGRYKLRIEVDIDCKLLRYVTNTLEEQNPSVRFFSYHDEYRKEVESICDFVVNENDTAYVLALGQVIANYDRSKNLLFLTSKRDEYSMRQTSLEHIQSFYPKLYIDPECQYKYEEVEQYYIDEVYRLYGDELRKYKEPIKEVITPKVEVKKTTTNTAPIKINTTIKYPNGNEYKGEAINNIPNGLGIYYYKSGVNNGCTISGNFINGKIEGLATINYKDGSYYIGDFKNNYKHGKGTLYKPDGKYERLEYNDGRLVTDKKDTTPITKSPTTSSASKPITTSNTPTSKSELKQRGNYYGEVINDKKNGLGIKVIMDTYITLGIYKNDVLDGPHLKIHHNDLYIGLEHSNLSNKFCMKINNNCYKFSDNFPYKTLTKSIFVTPNKYNNCLNKETKLHKREAFNYIGTSILSIKESFGIRYNVNGKTHFGEFKNHKLNGYGMIYDDNTLYIGELKDDVYNGYGMLVTNYKRNDYNATIGKWNNGKFEK